MFLYSWLHLSGYASVDIEQIKKFRALGSHTPGHPESKVLDGKNLILGRSLQRVQDRQTVLPGMFHAVPPRMPLMTIAGPRQGKGVSTIIPNLLVYAGSMLVLDVKGENFAWTGEARRRRLGQRSC